VSIVILEGCDATGKTRLASELEALGHLVKHYQKPDRPPIEALATEVSRASSTDRLVLDRFHWSSPVYGSRYYPDEQELYLTDAQFRWLELALLSRGALVVHCTGDEVHTTLRARGDAYFDGDPGVQEIRSILDAYHRLAEASLLPVWTRSLDDPRDLETITADLVSRGAEEEATGTLSWASHAVGDLRHPRLLLVGEEPSPNAICDLPFLPYRSPAASFLWEALDGFDLRSLLLTNARDASGRETMLRELWSAVGRPAVVALGREAERALDVQGVPHGTVSHPMYVRRFHWHRRDRYRGAILEAAVRQEEVRI